jgi:hypothetical protein
LNLFQLAGLPVAAAAEVAPTAAAATELAVVDSVLVDSVQVDSATVGSATVGSATVGSATVGSVPVGAATALHLELQAPPPSVARSLRLSAGQPAVIVTIRFDDPTVGKPLALTVAVLRPEMFRLVLQTPSELLAEPDAGNLPGSWAHAVEGWEP